jgi:hypothetical protein
LTFQEHLLAAISLVSDLGNGASYSAMFRLLAKQVLFELSYIPRESMF